MSSEEQIEFNNISFYHLCQILLHNLRIVHKWIFPLYNLSSLEWDFTFNKRIAYFRIIN